MSRRMTAGRAVALEPSALPVVFCRPIEMTCSAGCGSRCSALTAITKAAAGMASRATTRRPWPTPWDPCTSMQGDS